MVDDDGKDLAIVCENKLMLTFFFVILIYLTDPKISERLMLMIYLCYL